MNFEKLDMKTINFTDENIKKLAEIFPNVVSEDENGKVIDFEALKQELSRNIVEGYKERYSLNWPGKREAQLKANTPTTKTLRPCIEDSVNFDTTENLYIEGDNLEVLKILQEGYLNKIKMIYIDPPYNTGNDFIYNDNFTRDSEEELIESGQINDEGGRLVMNLESNGRYHSDWLSMMYPRLKLARNLLKEYGILFLSIDENEIHNLRKICDEIFGEENFINTITVKMSEATGVKMAHAKRRLPKVKEYVLMYKKSKDIELDYSKVMIPVEKWGVNYKSVITNITNDEINIVRNLLNEEIITNEQLIYFDKLVKNIKLKTFSEVNTNWNKMSEEEKTSWKFDNAYRIVREVSSASAKKIADIKKRTITDDFFGIRTSQGKLYFIKNHYNDESKDPNIKLIFAADYMMVNPCDFWSDIKTTRLDQEGDILFNNGKKPLKLLERLLSLTTKQNDIVLDFFSGSASTAHATLKLNSEDDGSRKFIMIQIPEKIEDNDLSTICEIGKERIRRAGKKILEESGKTDLDIGFRVLKLDSSNMKDIYFTPQELGQSQMDYSVDNIKEDRSDLDLLFGVLIDWGVDLTLPIKKEIIQEKNCYFVDSDSLCAYFGNDINEEFIKELAKKEALRFVFKDSSFGNNDDLKDNVSQIFKQLNPSAEIKVI